MIPIVRAMVMRSTVTKIRACRLLWYVTPGLALLLFALGSILYGQQNAREDPGRLRIWSRSKTFCWRRTKTRFNFCLDTSLC